MDNRASVSLVGHIPGAAGSVVELKCNTHGLHPVRWFKDGRALDYEIENEPRIQVKFICRILELCFCKHP